MKRYLLTLIISLILALLAQLWFFENAFTYESISNALFIVGIMMFLIGLITLTEAAKLFMIVSYSFKSVLKRKDFKYKSYYDYMKDKEREEVTPYALQLLVIGGSYLTIAFILARFV